jgi:hypothetical protein
MAGAKPIVKAPGKAPVRARTGVYERSDSALRVRAQRVRRLVSAMRREMPWLTRADGPAMKGWAELEVLSATVFAWLLKLNVLNSTGEPRKLLDQHRQMKLAQLEFERELGMTPLSRSTLKLNSTHAALDLPAKNGPAGE